MKISWKHDKEEWDPYTLLGAIEIIDNFGNLIQDHCLILDTWLVAFAEGFLAIDPKQPLASIDTIDEPDRLFFVTKDSLVEVSWKGQCIKIDDLDKARLHLAKQLFSLADDLKKRAAPRDEMAIKKLVDFASRLSKI